LHYVALSVISLYVCAMNDDLCCYWNFLLIQQKIILHCYSSPLPFEAVLYLKMLCDMILYLFSSEIICVFSTEMYFCCYIFIDTWSALRLYCRLYTYWGPPSLWLVRRPFFSYFFSMETDSPAVTLSKEGWTWVEIEEHQNEN
jgi:hypothetical protein